MPRKLIAFLIAVYAIAFAFGALAAVRWPSLMMIAAATLKEGAPATGFEDVNWRELGILYGGPYFFAALCFYGAAALVAARRPGAVALYGLAAAAGFPCALMVDFESGWWRDPSVGEGAVAGAGLAALLLGAAVWELRRRPAAPKTTVEADVSSARFVNADGEVFVLAKAAPAPVKPAEPAQRRAAPVSAAILRQRESFAREGRRMGARKRRRLTF